VKELRDFVEFMKFDGLFSHEPPVSGLQPKQLQYTHAHG